MTPTTKPTEQDLKLADDIESGKIKDLKTNDGTKQNFSAVSEIRAVGGVLMLVTTEEAKRRDPRKFRDRLITLERGVDMYRNIGQLMIKMSRTGFMNMDELKDILDAYGRKILEAVNQCRAMNIPVSDKVLGFEKAFNQYHSALLAVADLPKHKLSDTDTTDDVSGSATVKK